MLEKTGFLLLAMAALLYFIAIIGALILAFPAGIIGLLAIGGTVLLFFQALSDRTKDTEGEHYSRNIDK